MLIWTTIITTGCICVCRSTKQRCCSTRIFTVGRLRSVFKKRLRPPDEHIVNAQNVSYVGCWLCYWNLLYVICGMYHCRKLHSL